MGKGSSGGAKYGVNSMGNATGAPKGSSSGGNLMNTTPPTSGGKPPMPPKGTSAKYGC